MSHQRTVAEEADTLPRASDQALVAIFEEVLGPVWDPRGSVLM